MTREWQNRFRAELELRQALNSGARRRHAAHFDHAPFELTRVIPRAPVHRDCIPPPAPVPPVPVLVQIGLGILLGGATLLLLRQVFGWFQ